MDFKIVFEKDQEDASHNLHYTLLRLIPQLCENYTRSCTFYEDDSCDEILKTCDDLDILKEIIDNLLELAKMKIIKRAGILAKMRNKDV